MEYLFRAKEKDTREDGKWIYGSGIIPITKEFYPIKEGVLDVVHQILDLENITEVDMQIRINPDGIPTVDAQIKMIAPSKQRIIERRK